MKRLLNLCVLLAVCLTACAPARSPDVKGTASAAPQALDTPTRVPTATAGPPTTLEPTSTSSPQPSPTHTPIPTHTPDPTSTATAIVVATATSSPAATPVLVEPEGTPHVVVGVAGDDVLNVRTGPGVENPLAGTIPYYGTEVIVTGRPTDVDGSAWVPVHFDQVTGWVNSLYLAEQRGSSREGVARRAADIVLALRDGDLQRLATLVHPEKGLRFSPYTYVRAENAPSGDRDLVFQADELAGLFADHSVYIWGIWDGRGDPIATTFGAYWDRFVYGVDFAQPERVGYDVAIGGGNTINNISDVYPDATVVEYYFSGFDPELLGLDWQSLRLVLEPLDDDWVLVGLVHDEWTI